VTGFDTAIPAVVAALAADEPLRAVWHNQVGGITFALGADRFVKYQPGGSEVDLAAEAQRLRWARRFTAVPDVLATGADAAGQWLLTAALPGSSAVSPRWIDEPLEAVTAIGRGLRHLHDRLPVDLCPFDWSTTRRVARAKARGRSDPADWFSIHRDLDRGEAFNRLHNPPPIDRLVVCHGDACAPNTLIGEDGRCTGHVDLGALGVADRWADLAVATWSTEWNYGPGWEPALLEAYGVAPDPVRTAYYRLLWDLSP
jgi:kanamycin kinase